MNFSGIEFQRVSKDFQIYKAIVSNDHIKNIYLHLIEAGAKLLCLWGEDNGGIVDRYYLNITFYLNENLLVLKLHLDSHNPHYQDLTPIFPSANRMQRAVFDLLGIKAMQTKDERPWLSHHKWPINYFPLQKEDSFVKGITERTRPYFFMRVSGQGVHEIPVGPIHAGIIESGHFRFQVVGEKILRLEARLGYKHKGIEKRFEKLHFFEAAKLAGRISGDSTVAFSWAYAMAIETVADILPPKRALWIRALLLERERMMNHLGDIGALINDTGFAFGLAHFSRLKEDMLRINELIFGHRYLMDLVIPGGVQSDLNDEALKQIRGELAIIKNEVQELKKIIDQHGGVQDRFNGTGILNKSQAEDLEVFGLCARASGIHCDQRVHNPTFPYTDLKVNEIIKSQGDVGARVEVRFGELFEAIRLLNHILDELKIVKGAIAIHIHEIPDNKEGYGWVEGFRGAVFIALKTGKDNFLSRVHPHDPSYSNWPALEVAVLGNIVPDFPLINKSFNLNYAGHDL
ncbi:MAG: NADH-quinone oxidoreductase subunit C [Candidatus Berkiella sp.]